MVSKAIHVDWASVKGEFDLDASYRHFSAFLIASNPRRVRDAIERHRRGFDSAPSLYFERNVDARETALNLSAEGYLGAPVQRIAFTESTTVGLGLSIGGLRLRSSDEILTTIHDHFALHETLRLRADACGATVRKFVAYERSAEVTTRELLNRVVGAVGPKTRVLALTWVHSDSGIKLPLAAIAGEVARINEERGNEDRLLLVVDGVHGFAVENAVVGELGCDFFAAGCHKWLFGPRGTGIVVASPNGLTAHGPVLASNSDAETKRAWRERRGPDGGSSGPRIGPGGLHAYEHRWALAEAFDWHASLGTDRVAHRIHELASRLKRGLTRCPRVSLRTPLSPDVSSGFVCFDVQGREPHDVVASLEARGILVSGSPYRSPCVRVTPSVLNDESEIDELIDAVGSL